MAFALVNNSISRPANDTFNPAVTITVPQTTVGNLLVVVAYCGANLRTVSTVTGGATFSRLHQISDSAAMLEVWAGICTSQVTSITVTCDGNSDTFYDTVAVLEFSGPASPLAESGTSTGATNTAPTTTHEAAAVTPATSETVFVGALFLGGSPSTWTPDVDFSELYAPASAPNMFALGYRIQSGSTTAQAYTNTSASSRTSRVVLVAIQGATGGGFRPAWARGSNVVIQ